MTNNVSQMIILRQAQPQDVETLERWDREPHVIKSVTDDSDAEVAFGDHDWHQELAEQTEFSKFYIAEKNGTPIGAMQIIDPHNEHTHYWGEIEPHLRAVDIWIGEQSELGKGYGEEMMRQACAICFSDPTVTAIVIDPLASNERGHKFYQRIGFKAEGRRMFGPDDCLVHRLTRADWKKYLA